MQELLLPKKKDGHFLPAKGQPNYEVRQSHVELKNNVYFAEPGLR